MAEARQQHVGKTREEQENYVSTVLNQTPQPTIEQFEDYDSTDTSRAPETRRQTAVPVGRRRRRGFWETVVSAVVDNPIPTIIITVGLGLCSYIFYVHNIAFGLNREIGALKATFDEYKTSSSEELKRLYSSIEKWGERVIKNEDRVNTFYERDTKVPQKSRR
jgi:hypothetical protein